MRKYMMYTVYVAIQQKEKKYQQKMKKNFKTYVVSGYYLI